MQRKHRIYALVVVAVLALAAWWWLGRDDSATRDESARGSSDAAGRGEGKDDGPGKVALRQGQLDPWQAARATVTGTVRDEQGRPVAGAQVCAELRDPELASLDRFPPQCANSREDGTYRLADVLGAAQSLSAAKPGFLPARYRGRAGVQQTTVDQLELVAGQTRSGIDFVLVEGGVEVQGVVMDLAGGVVEGAFVSSLPSWRAESGATFTRSDEEGRFTLWVAGPETTIRAWAEGYALGTRRAAVPGTFVEVFMTPESVVTGTVVWADSGKPVAGARVGTSGAFWGRGNSVVTEEDGSFRIDGLEPGRYKLDVSDEEILGLADEAVHVGLGQTSEPITIRVHRAFYVRAQVLVDGETPCSFAEVTLRDAVNKRANTRYGQPREDGTVLVKGLLPGTYEVTVDCRGYLAEDEYPDVVIAEASLDDVRWSVHAGRTIRGKVVDQDGQGLEGAQVGASMKAAEDPRGRRVDGASERTESSGEFLIAGLLPGTYQVSASHRQRPDLVKPLEVVVPADEDVTEIVVELPSGGHVTGTVRGDDGRPVGDVSVSLRGPSWGSARTNDEGRFVMENVRVGTYRIVAQRGWSEQMRAPGKSDDDVAGERIEVIADETTEIDLLVESQNGRITGRVLDESGEPVADAFVDATRESDSAAAASGGQRRRARWGGWDRKPVLTDEDGRFELTDLAEQGTYAVHANRKGGGEALAEHVAVGADVELSVAATGVLAGVVRIAGGGTPERFSVSAVDRPASLAGSDSFLRTDGRFRLTNLSPGTYEVTVDAPEGNVKTTVELAEGEDVTNLELELTSRVTVRGRLVDAETGEPVPGLKVGVGNGMGMGINFGQTKANQPEVSDADGRFEVADAPTGKVTVSIVDPGFTDTGYDWTSLRRDLPPEPAVQDLGTIELIKKRVDRGQEAGDLGFTRKEPEPGAEPDQMQHLIAVVRPGGPAAQAGLAVGDEIVAVDGQKVTGADYYRYRTLMRVAVGTTVKLELASGRDVSITAGPAP